MGPLISAEEMTRCIHCTRCVRFGQEIAGVMELGMAGRGEHSEIMTFVGRSVDSELSGNMIDLCPVGALTSKPFRYEARAWELSRRKSVSPHDSLGSNLIVQVKNQRVLRVLPLENAAVNECWLSDRDRFSYEGLHAADRLGKPMLKQDGQWREVDWPDALEYVRHALQHVRQQHGPASIGALAAPSSTLEELHLLAKLVRGIGSDNIDHRLRQTDFSGDAAEQGVPWLGLPVQDIDALDRVLLVGSFLRKDHPLLSARLRHAVRRGCQLSVVHATDDDLLMRVANQVTSRPSAWARGLAGIAVAIAEQRGLTAPVTGVVPDETARAIAASLLSGERKAVFLGNAAVQHPAAATLRAWAQWIAQATGATLGVLTEAANSVGAHLVGARPLAGGLDARRMVEQARRAYLLWNFEPEYDTADPVAMLAALRQADTVIAFSPYRNGALEYADAILPIAPFTETAGTFVNCEGRVQGFNGTVRPLGDARPGWKVLRVLGNLLELDGFDFETSEAVRDAAMPADLPARLSNAISVPLTLPAEAVEGIERLADVPIYFADAIVRRSPPLQATADARPPRARVNARTAAPLSLIAGDRVRVSQGSGSALLDLQIDERLADGVVRVAAAHPSTAALGLMFGPVRLERA
jgi:NADH-quinone oxidoreductase subunit G